VSALATDAPKTRARAVARLLPPAGTTPSLADHVTRYGRLPSLRGEGAALIAEVEASVCADAAAPASRPT